MSSSIDASGNCKTHWNQCPDANRTNLKKNKVLIIVHFSL